MIPQSEPHWVATQPDVDALAAHLRTQARVAVDTEFHGERSYVPHLMLVQVATEDDIWLVDPLADVDLKPLFESLSGPEPLVIGHALHNDLEILFLAFGTVFQGVFDTQVAASFLGFGLQVGLVGLMREVAQVSLPKGAQMADWSRRPLPPRQAEYAANDVRYLLHAHHVLATDLERRGRLGWVMQECGPLGDAARYRRDPQLAYRRVSGFRKLRPHEGGVLVELAAARERIAAEQDIVPHFLVSDDVLTALARRMPKRRDDLKGNRRLNNRNVHRYAEQWIAAVERGQGTPLPRPKPLPPRTPGMDAAAALIMLMVNEVADREDLAPQLLLKRKIVQHVLQLGVSDKDALLEGFGLHGWRRELLGELIWDLLDGRVNVACERDPEAGLGVVFRHLKDH